MATLIDGYNLLHVTGIIGRGVGPGTLDRARRALLNFLAASLLPDELPRTTVVFDAANPPPGLPRSVDHQGLTVRFAVGHEDADALLEELIRRDSAPRQLVVVSSDHRVQRAARRRRATAVDSDVWYDQLVRRRAAPRPPQLEVEGKPPAPLSQAEVDRWLEEFADGIETLPPPERPAPPPPKPGEPRCTELDNPFPPGYGEDLLHDKRQR